MASSNNGLHLTIKDSTPYSCHATITIPASFIDALYSEASIHQKKSAHTYGFQKGTAPLSFIKEAYKSHLTEHIKEFLFKYCVISFLYKELITQKIFFAGQPRLMNMYVEPNAPAYFDFELSLIPALSFLPWKDFTFKAPKRKNYKDIDRQVEAFLKEEHNPVPCSAPIAIHDWICFDIYPLNQQTQPLFEDYKENLWLRLGDEEADQPLQELFLNHAIGDVFYSNNSGLQEYFSDQLDTEYNFCIEIKDILPHQAFDLGYFKHHFNLKNQKDINAKLIEVFSFRNDISQRRSMVEDALQLLLTKHSFDIPKHLILRQQKLLLEAVQQNPDYLVYKNQADFEENILQLATKQIRETIFIDQLSCKEHITVTPHDIKGYLNLLKRPRTKEFIYFNIPSTKIKGQEIPLQSELLKQYCLREKTLNHVIHHWTKK